MRAPILFLLMILLFTSSLSFGQTIKRSSFSFYGTAHSNLLSTAGQSINCAAKDSAHQLIIGFQQPLYFSVDTQLNILNDSILCADEKIILRANHANAVNKWYRNDTLVLNNSADSLTINKSGTYSLTASDGIRSIKNSKAINFTFLQKPTAPTIFSLKKDSTICVLDTVHLSAESNLAKFVWSNGDTSSNIKVYQPNLYYVHGYTRIGNGNKFCISDTSNKITVVKNFAPIPSIIRVSDNLVSSQSIKFKWYFNNLYSPNDTTNSIRIKSKGLYKVKTSLDNFCWSESADYFVQTDPTSFQQKELDLSAYPNPTNGVFFLHIRLERRYSGFVKITFVDPVGNIKWSFNNFVFNESNIKIPINLNFNRGSFTVQVSLNGYKPKSIQMIGL